MTLLRRTLLFVALSLNACSLFSEPRAAVVSLRTLASPTDIQLGDTARIQIEVTNISGNTVEIGPSGCNMDFVIVSASGSVFNPAELVACPLALMAPIPLAPGAKRLIDVFTTGRVIPQGSQAAPSMLSPATYSIRGVVYVLRGNQEAITVQSDPVSVTFRN